MLTVNVMKLTELFETIDILPPHEEGQDDCGYRLKSEIGQS